MGLSRVRLGAARLTTAGHRACSANSAHHDECVGRRGILRATRSNDTDREACGAQTEILDLLHEIVARQIAFSARPSYIDGTAYGVTAMTVRFAMLVMVSMLSACAAFTTRAPDGDFTWPTYSHSYTKDGVQYVYQYPYGPYRVVTPSSPLRGEERKDPKSVAPAASDAPPGSK